MSRLDELIQELCPDGVEHKSLGDITRKITDGMHNLPKNTSSEGIYPIISAQNINNGSIDFFTQRFVTKEVFDKENKRTQAEQGDVLLTIVGALGRVAVIEREQPMLFQRSVCVIKPDFNVIHSRFLRYVLETTRVQKYIQINAHGAAQKGLYLSEVSKIVIPVPPLEVQREIVRILDNFTEQVAELKDSLAAELAARKKQYEYYRDELLAANDSAKWMTLGEIATIVRGASPRPIKNFVTNDKDGVNWIKIGDVPAESKYVTSAKEKITSAGAEKSRFVKAGDFILSNSMSFGRPYILKIDGCIHDGWLAISAFEQYVIPDYLYYILVSSDIQREMAKKASFGGAVQNLNADIVRSISIPVPSIEEQKNIVAILDRFNTLCNDISAGLPAEIEARQKQYEYYRDKLLTFKEKKNAAG